MFKKGDKVETVLRGAGVVTKEEGTILYVKNDIAYVDNGPGNDPTPYHKVTGKSFDDGWGFERWIEKVEDE